jgi:undecaprenyl-diphosphatase
VIDYRLPGDDVIFQALNGLKNPTVDAVMVFVTGREFGIIAQAMVALWVITGLRRHAVRPVLQAALAYGITDFVGARVLKPWFDRERPCFVLPKGTFRQLVDIGHSGSMPSLHAANSFAVAMAITLVWPAAGRVVFPVAVLVALSRIFVGVHWPSDVLAGALYGALVAVLIHLIGRKIRVRDSAVVHS